MTGIRAPTLSITATDMCNIDPRPAKPFSAINGIIAECEDHRPTVDQTSVVHRLWRKIFARERLAGC